MPVMIAEHAKVMAFVTASGIPDGPSIMPWITKKREPSPIMAKVRMERPSV